MKLFKKEVFSERNIPVLLLLAAGIIEFLFITLESLFSYIGYYLAETYLIVPCLLFLGYALRGKQTVFARRRLMLAAAAISWFVVVQCIHKLSGMDNHPMATVFFVYLMAFPFAALADDRKNRGLWGIGGIFVAASFVLVLYTLLLLLDLVPAGMREVLYWDGARLHALWHPNISACYFMIGIGFSVAFFMRSEKNWIKAFLLAAIVVQLLAMALTNCRTTLLLTGALLGGAVFFRIFRGNWKQLVLGLLAAVVLLAGTFKVSGMVFRWNNDQLIAAQSAAREESPETEKKVVIHKETGDLVGKNNQGTLSGDMRTLNGRTPIWSTALTAVRDSKVLALFGTEYPGTVITAYNPYYPVVHSHNSWIEALMRMGLPGLLMALVFTAIPVWSAARLVLRQGTELWKKVIAMTAMCVMAAGVLEPYLFITNVYYHIMDFMFFFLTGYLDYWCRPEQRETT